MKLNVLVADVMTRDVKRVNVDDTIEKAAKMMRDNMIGSVVVSSDRHVKGIVTTTDIVYKHIAGKKGPLVKDIMSPELVKIAPSATIEAAARLMVEKNIEKLLVFDNDSFVGIITNNDIIRIEPAIVEILLERQKMGGPRPASDVDIAACENCGNFSDDLDEINGQFICQECRN